MTPYPHPNTDLPTLAPSLPGTNHTLCVCAMHGPSYSDRKHPYYTTLRKVTLHSKPAALAWLRCVCILHKIIQ